MEKSSATERQLLKYLNEFNISEVDYLKGKNFDQLITIESYLQELTKNQSHYYNMLKESKKINVNKISKNTNLSRSSIYNSPSILLYYINMRIERISSQDLTFINSFDQLSMRVNLLENINDGLKQQVVESYESKLYISELEEEIKILLERRNKDITEINSLKEEIKILQTKLNQYRIENVIKLYED